MLAAFGDRANVRRLQYWWDVGAGDRAAAVIGVQHDCLERALAEPIGGQPRVAEYWPGPVPGLAEVQL
jgi:hypothetical protein